MIAACTAALPPPAATAFATSFWRVDSDASAVALWARLAEVSATTDILVFPSVDGDGLRQAGGELRQFGFHVDRRLRVSNNPDQLVRLAWRKIAASPFDNPLIQIIIAPLPKCDQRGDGVFGVCVQGD